MRVRDKKQTWTGWSGKFNTHSLGEVIVGFDGEGGMDSMFISELDVYLDSKEEWVDMYTAFKNNYLISDNLDVYFREPKSEEEIIRGYY